MLASALRSIPIYSMSMYLLPKTILKKIDVIRKRFFWQGGNVKRKYHLVKWLRICQLKKKGGLCVKDLWKMNISLMCKWWWKLERSEGLWQEIVRKKYVKNGCLHSLKRSLLIPLCGTNSCVLRIFILLGGKCWWDREILLAFGKTAGFVTPL